MELLRERFLKTYANIPLSLRDDIVLLIEDSDGPKRPITWNVAYIEVKGNTEKASAILHGLDKLDLI